MKTAEKYLYGMTLVVGIITVSLFSTLLEKRPGEKKKKADKTSLVKNRGAVPSVDISRENPELERYFRSLRDVADDSRELDQRFGAGSGHQREFEQIQARQPALETEKDNQTPGNAGPGEVRLAVLNRGGKPPKNWRDQVPVRDLAMGGLSDYNQAVGSGRISAAQKKQVSVRSAGYLKGLRDWKKSDESDSADPKAKTVAGAAGGGKPVVAAGSGDTGKFEQYLVRSGDSLWGLSRLFGTTIGKIKTLNPQLKKRPLYVGEKIRIPASKKARRALLELRSNKEKAPAKADTKKLKKKVGDKQEVASGGDAPKEEGGAAKKEKTSKTPVKSGHKNTTPAKKEPQGKKTAKSGKSGQYEWKKVFTRPVGGPVTSGFGYRKDPFNSRRRYFHPAVDIAADMFTPVISTGDGKVIFAGRSGGYGNKIIIRHPYGYVSSYSHLAKMVVKKGDIVRKGQKIGEIGRTGNVTAAHLHFEIRKWRKAIDPLSVFDKKIKVKKEDS